MSEAPSLAVAAWTTLQGGAVTLYILAQAGLVLLSAHRYTLLAAGGRARRQPRLPEHWPHVTVQLPLYNERRVAERLIGAVAALDYPRERLEVQVLDDSDDETRELVGAAVARARRGGLDVRHLVRPERRGFKAGALAHGLTIARGELVAIFDADFVPAPDVLRRLVPHFGDPGVGMVQARWGHLNRDESVLTRAQATMLDAHFLVEHASRMERGLLFNFNGTAGIWRRACIEDAGGWSHDTLTEDLDLSYRAQLAGWRFVFDPDTVCPAELPAAMSAFQSQQRRWARGSIQTARKLLGRIWRSTLAPRQKTEATLHLLSNAAYPLLLALALLLLPVLLGRSVLTPAAAWVLQGGVLALGLLPVALFLFRGRRRSGATPVTAWRDTVAALLLGAGLCVNNTRAVLAGLGGRVGAWERTPKRGGPGIRHAPYQVPLGAAGRAELLLGLHVAALLAWSLVAGQYRALPFLLMLAGGLAWVGRASHREARRVPTPAGGGCGDA